MSVKLFAAFTAAFAAGVAFTDRQSDLRGATAEREYPPTGQFVDVNGRKVHAVVDGQGPDVVLIHGAGGNTREFTFSFMERLTDRFRVIVFDRPGLGYSDHVSDDYVGAFRSDAEGPAEQAAVLQAAAAQLGADRPIVVGHSYGGTVALAWGLNHPDDLAGVVNIAGPSHPWPGDLGAYYTLNGSALGGILLSPVISAFATRNQIDTAIEGIFAPQAVPEGYVDHIGAALTLRPGNFRANARQVNTLRPHVVEMAARYADEFIAPLEILHGDQDATVPLHIHSIPLKSAVPHANLTVLDGVGHMPHHIHPDLVEAAIDRIAAQVQ